MLVVVAVVVSVLDSELTIQIPKRTPLLFRAFK